MKIQERWLRLIELLHIIDGNRVKTMSRKTELNNYSPVCTLLAFSKIFQRILYDRMINYIDKHNILSKNQFGFRKGLSTENAIINFIDKIYTGLENRHHTVAYLWISAKPLMY